MHVCTTRNDNFQRGLLFAMGQVLESCVSDNCLNKQIEDAGAIPLSPLERDKRILEARERKSKQIFSQNLVLAEFDKGLTRMPPSIESCNN